MSRARHLESSVGVVAAILLFGSVAAGTRTYVTFAGRDDTLPKLGRPGIAVRVDGPIASGAFELAGELTRELAHQVHTRPLANGEEGDYDLSIAFEAPKSVGQFATVPFAAVLTSARGERLWRIEGRSDVEGAPVDAAVFSGIGRNVVSALIHDGWVQPRYDPDNPPPQPPKVRSE